MVVSAFVQEGVSRVVSFMLGKREETASQGHNTERLEMAISQLEFAVERTGNLPITDLSLVHRMKMLKRAYVEGADLLDKHNLQALQGHDEIGQGVKRSKLWITHAKNSSVSSSAGLNTDNVRRFEWFADCAGKFVRDVESGCSLRHYTFCNPLVRHLLEGKTLRYETVEGSLERRFYMQPICLEGRGVETMLEYHYEDCKMPEKTFHLALMLRLSESTDIVGTAIKCLQSMASQFKLLTETAMGELTLIANLQYISHSHGPLWASMDEVWYTEHSQRCRPDPVCCKANGHGPCADNLVSSELPHIFPEQVIGFYINCHIPALEYILRSSSDEVGRSVRRDRRSPLELTLWLLPHAVDEEHQEESYAAEMIGEYEESRDVSIHQVAETVRSNTINRFLRQPELTDYRMEWRSKHGTAFFVVEKPSTERAGVPAKTKT